MVFTINHHHFFHFAEENLIIEQLKLIKMTQAEATQILTDVRAKVDTFIAGGAASGNITPELEAAINGVKSSVDGLPTP